MNKLLVHIPSEVFARFSHALADDIRLTISHAYHSLQANGDYLSIVQPTAFEAASVLTAHGCTVLPGMHDPEPIGDHHRYLAHVNAQPHETMRQVALRLHAVHGPAFHPDY